MLLLRDAPEQIEAIKYLQRKGGVLVGHGYTHQWDGGRNPYNGVTGDDVEFYRVTEAPRRTRRLQRTVPEDSSRWADRRVASMNREFEAAGIGPARIFEFPHYAASSECVPCRRAPLRRAMGAGVLFLRACSTSEVRPRNGSRRQFFPYVVRDVYGSKVLPENLGSINPEPWHGYAARRPEDIVAAARANLVVRDGFAAFFFHPFLDLDYLRRTIAGIRRLGYRFVSPASL